MFCPDITVLVAMERELSGIQSYLNKQWKTVEYTENHTILSFKKRHLLILKIGIGSNSVKRNLQKALHKFRFKLIISTGFSGALTEGIKVGDICIPKTIKDIHDNKESIHLNNSLIDSFIKNGFNGRVHRGLISLTVDRIYSSKDKGSLLYNHKDVSLIDMETYAIRETLNSKEIIFLSIRSVSDDCKFEFPVLDFYSNDSDSVNYSRLLKTIFFKPAILLSLFKLYANSRKASKENGLFLIAFLDYLIENELIGNTTC